MLISCLKSVWGSCGEKTRDYSRGTRMGAVVPGVIFVLSQFCYNSLVWFKLCLLAFWWLNHLYDFTKLLCTLHLWFTQSYICYVSSVVFVVKWIVCFDVFLTGLISILHPPTHIVIPQQPCLVLPTTFGRRVSNMKSSRLLCTKSLGNERNVVVISPRCVGS